MYTEMTLSIWNTIKMIADIKSTENQIIHFLFCLNKLTINKITTKTKETKTAISKKYFFTGHAVYSKLYQLPYIIYSWLNKKVLFL